MFVEPVTRACATASGWYPSWAAAASTRSLVSGRTFGEPWNVRVTVAIDTPLRRATSRIVAEGGPIFAMHTVSLFIAMS
ncbi:hypothetical protein GCM10010522_30930 [Kribbella solani]